MKYLLSSAATAHACFPLPRVFHLFLMLLLWSWSCALAAEVDARLSHTTTSLERPVMLRLTITGDNDAYPDLSVLEADFEILGRSQQQSVSVINGQRSKTQTLNLTLLPKHTGQLTLPAIPVGQVASPALRLEVVASETTDENGDETEAFIQLELDKPSAYQQEELILTVRLYLAEGLMGESFGDPRASLEQTEIRLLNEEQYPAQHAGQTYRVVERRYAVYARQPGRLTLEGVSFRGRAAGANTEAFFEMLREPFNAPVWGQRIVSAESERVHAEIKPIPDAFSGKHWLPARSLQLMESGLKSAPALTAGQPVTRQILLIVEGQPAARLPQIPISLPKGMNQYPERSRIRDNVLGSGITGTLHTSVTLVATQPGRYLLPAIELPWWNTQSDRQEIARLPADRLQVAASPAGPPAMPNSQPFAEAFDESVVPFSSLEDQTEAVARVDAPPRAPLFNWLVWLLALGWLMTLYGWWYSVRRAKRRPAAAVATPQPKPAEQPVKHAFDDILTALIAAYRARDPQAAKAAWLRWGNFHWPAQPPSNLNRLAERSPPRIAHAVQALDNAIYSPANRDDWAAFSPEALLEDETDGRDSKPGKSGRPLPVNP